MPFGAGAGGRMRHGIGGICHRPKCADWCTDADALKSATSASCSTSSRSMAQPRAHSCCVTGRAGQPWEACRCTYSGLLCGSARGRGHIGGEQVKPLHPAPVSPQIPPTSSTFSPAFANNLLRTFDGLHCAELGPGAHDPHKGVVGWGRGRASQGGQRFASPQRGREGCVADLADPSSPPNHPPTNTQESHLEETLLDQAQARTPYNPAFLGVIRVAHPRHDIGWPTPCKIIILPDRTITQWNF